MTAPAIRKLVGHYARLLLRPQDRRRRAVEAALRRLERLPKGEPVTTDLLGPAFEAADGPTFALLYREILTEESYRFSCDERRPFIIDCGANVGLSVIYFKRRFPDARVLAIEPDPRAFQMLERNLGRFGLHDVERLQAAVWTSEGEAPFMPVSGLMSRLQLGEESGGDLLSVPTVRLADHLADRVDLLKLDIEGAETEVLESCCEKLDNVRRLFVEYHSHKERPQSLHELLGRLAEAGFRYSLKTAYAAEHPLDDMLRGDLQRAFDLQVNVYAWRPGDAGETAAEGRSR